MTTKLTRRRDLPRDGIDALQEGLVEIGILAKDPHSRLADDVCDRVVQRYNTKVFVIVASQGLLGHSRWPTWHRLVFVRFLQLICTDQPGIAAVIGRALTGDKRPHPDHLLREAFRRHVIDVIALGRTNKAKSPADRDPALTSFHVLWQEALRSLEEDMRREQQRGRTLEQAPPDWFHLLGCDYSLDAVPNLTFATPSSC